MDDQIVVALPPIGSVNNTPAIDTRDIESQVWAAYAEMEAERRKPIGKRAAWILLLVMASAAATILSVCPPVATRTHR